MTSAHLHPPAGTVDAAGPAGLGPTVLGTWTATLVRALDAHGCDGRRLAREAGVPVDALDDPAARIPLSASSRLWERAVEATGDPCFGLEVSRFVGPGTFHGLGVAILASTTLASALGRIARFAPVVIDRPGHAELVDEGDVVELRMRYVAEGPSEPGVGGEPTAASVEAVLAAVVRTFRFLARRRVGPVAVQLRRPSPVEGDRFERFFGCPVRYGAPEYRMAFAHHDLDRALPSGCAEAALAADAAVGNHLDRVLVGGSVVADVRGAVGDLLTEGRAVTSAAVAARLAMSERTLQRRLQAEGTRFRDVATGVRIDRARELLVAGGLGVAQVAERLGFSDTATFRRTFKRWTGTTPGGLVARPRSAPGAPGQAPRT